MSTFKGLIPRVVSGLIGATIIITSIYLGPWSFLLVWCTILGLTLHEYYQILKEEGYNVNQVHGVLLGCMLFIVAFFIQLGYLSFDAFLFLIPFFYLVFINKLYQKEKKAFRNLSYFFHGIIYIALPFTLINFLVFDNHKYVGSIFIGLMLLIWVNDVGAYFFGTFFGKHKLFERISPKKTWQGTIGGTLFTLVFSFFVAYLFPVIMGWQWIVISQMVVLFGTYGDLIESQFKRSIKIKDSGNAIPGHGGFMDRFDSMIICIPFVLLFLKLC